MSKLLKFMGGVAFGAALGVGVYLVLTQEDETGVLSDVKAIIANAVEEGKQAAQAQRRLLEQELRFD
ncbi:MAG: hypothetical protein DSY55_00450 [Clostridia bacterium]|nr:MAG: hypothetical protein DSY55_00450 [Clostridia bacterium]